MPACGVTADEMANAIASGSATRPTVTPAIRSAAKAAPEYCFSARTDLGVQGCGTSLRLEYFDAPALLAACARLRSFRSRRRRADTRRRRAVHVGRVLGLSAGRRGAREAECQPGRPGR